MEVPSNTMTEWRFLGLPLGDELAIGKVSSVLVGLKSTGFRLTPWRNDDIGYYYLPLTAYRLPLTAYRLPLTAYRL